MKLQIIAFFCILILSVKGQHTEKLSETAKLIFPEKPTVTDTANVKMFTLIDTGCVYIAGVEGMDHFPPNSSIESLYSLYINNFLQGGKAKLLAQKDITVGVLKGKEVEFEYPYRDVFNKGVLRLVYINSKFYSYYLVGENTEILKREAPAFLDSFTLSGPVNQDIIDETSNEYRIGFLIGRLGLFALIASIVIVVIVIARRKNRNNPSKIS
ncbi:MAG: hypothetical protein K0S32_876 [Bacteroidetes bacterium]|jgi:hypothetical protein|nr:hypothetical protein [Bacteroidota bacterium]